MWISGTTPPVRNASAAAGSRERYGDTETQAAGVGKVGAYLNYFLELYVGLVWLCALALTIYRPPSTVHRLATLLVPALVIAALHEATSDRR